MFQAQTCGVQPGDSVFRIAVDHVSTQLGAGDRQGVLRAVESAYELVRQRRDPRMKGELAAWLWRVGALEGEPAEIAEPYAQEITGNWRAAAFNWKRLGCPYECACLLAWHGAETEQREALEVLERLGAAPAALALRKRMRAEGIRAVPRGSRTSPAAIGSA